MKKKQLDLSLICIYNKKEQLDDYLIKSYNNQNVECELILIDNRKQKFFCAADAINYGISQSTKNNIIILHQDIIFTTNKSLESIYYYIDNNKNSVIGIAGVTFLKEKKKKIVYGNLYCGYGKRIHPPTNIINDKIHVTTVDECLFGFNKKILEKINFDNKVCDNWHLYAADLCYQALLNNIEVYSIPSQIQHVSSGVTNHSFYEGISKLQKKYQNNFDRICTCCINIKMDSDPFKIEKKENRKKLYYKLKEIYVRYSWTIKDRIKKLWRKLCRKKQS